MKLRHLPVIFLLLTSILPIQAKEIAFDLDNFKQIRSEINSTISADLLETEILIDRTKISTPEQVEKIASNFVDRLYKAFSIESEELNLKEFEYLIKTLKVDIIELASIQGKNIDLLEVFINSYHKKSLTYGAMQTPIDLFLNEITKGNGLVTTIKMLEGNQILIEKITRMNVETLTWESYINTNSREILLSLTKTNRPVMAKFSKMIESTLSPRISQADRQIITRLSVLNDIAKIAEEKYDLVSETARYGRKGDRAILKAQSLQETIGRLNENDAKFLDQILKATNPSSLERKIAGAKGWIQGLTKWCRQSFKPKGNVILSVGAMVAITVFSELIREYSVTPSTSYLSTIDEINDSLEIGNFVNLVYKSIYDVKFAQVLDTTFEEDLDEEEQIAYVETLVTFNKAAFDVFFQETEEKINKEIYNCVTYGKDCAKA